jgi:large subunit ribosomal protein L10e
MAGLRKGHCYSPVKRSYTRKSKVRGKNFIKTIPANRIIRYIMGDKKKQFKCRLNLVTKKGIQIRHNALESVRQTVNRRLGIKLGTDYLFMLRVYPHHVLRENRMLTGAGADRMQQGMQKAFGSPIGLAAQLRKGQTVFSVDCDKAKVDLAKGALKMATPRLPGQYSIVIEEIKN